MNPRLSPALLLAAALAVTAAAPLADANQPPRPAACGPDQVR